MEREYGIQKNYNLHRRTLLSEDQKAGGEIRSQDQCCNKQNI